MRRRASSPFVTRKQAVRLVRSRAGLPQNPAMARLAVLAVAAALLVSGSSTAVAGPVTQQNGKTPVFKAFTSICAVPGYVNYGNCAGDPTTYTDVTGKVNAVQAKAGSWNLGVSFNGLEPGRYYRLWGNRTGSTPAPARSTASSSSGRPSPHSTAPRGSATRRTNQVSRLRPEHPRRPRAAPRHHGRHVVLVGAGPPGAEPGRHAVRPAGLGAVLLEQGARLLGLRAQP